MFILCIFENEIAYVRTYKDLNCTELACVIPVHSVMMIVPPELLE